MPHVDAESVFRRVYIDAYTRSDGTYVPAHWRWVRHRWRRPRHWILSFDRVFADQQSQPSSRDAQTAGRGY